MTFLRVIISISQWPFQKWPDVFRGPAPVQDFQILGQNIAPIGLMSMGNEYSVMLFCFVLGCTDEPGRVVSSEVNGSVSLPQETTVVWERIQL